MQAHGLGVSEIFRVSHRQAGGPLVVDGPLHQHPVGTGMVALESILAFTCEKRKLGIRIPISVSSQGKATVVIFHDLERRIGGCLLFAKEINDENTVILIGTDRPLLMECRPRLAFG